VIDVERSQPAPASLAVGKGWRGQDVIDQLFEDFLGKCYLCEAPFFGKGSFEVDHRWPRDAGGAHFDWANLFPVCRNCNGRRSKSWPEGGLLDPSAGHGVETRLVQGLEPDHDGELVPAFRTAAANDPAAANTAAELEHIHNHARGSGRLKAADLRDAIRKRTQKVQGEVLEYLHTRLKNPDDEQRIRAHEQRIRRLVARDAPFTMLVRSAIRRYVLPELFD
jgi:hypothetical protein